MNMIWSSNLNSFRNRVTIRTAVNFDISQIASFIGEENYLKSLIFPSEFEVGFKDGTVLSCASYWSDSCARRNLNLKAVAAAITKFRKQSNSKLRTQLLRNRKLTLRTYELLPEFSALRCVWHLLSNVGGNPTP